MRGKDSQDRSAGRRNTAAELLAELAQDPGFAAREQEVARVLREHQRTYAEAASGLLQDLASCGFHVESVGELRRSQWRYEAAIPVLLQWLPNVSYVPLKQDLVAALAVPWARPAAGPVLVREFQRSRDPELHGLRWAVGSALEAVADDSIRDDLVRLVQDKAWGTSRQMLVLALARTPGTGVVPLLRELLGDEDVVGHAIMALGLLGARSEIPALAARAHHRDAWIRNEVVKAIAMIEARSV